MDSYVFENTSNDGSEVVLSSNTETSSTNIQKLNIGDLSTTGYTFPSTIGLTNQILVANTTTKTLDWSNQSSGGGGDISNGGQLGMVSIGSTDNKLTLQGNQGIHIIGGIEYQYDNIVLNNANFNITDFHYFIEVSGSGNNTLLLPEADNRTGKLYIISKGYSGGTLVINTQTADKIDGEDTLSLTIDNQRIKIISSGVDRWLII